MGTISLAILGALLVVLQSPTDAAVPPQDGLSRTNRETMEDEGPVLYFPKATNSLMQKKRQWTIPPINFPENDRGPFPKKVVQMEDEVAVLYFPEATNGLKRKKREWIIPPINIPENDRGPFPRRVVQIRSSREEKIHYSITGPGVDLPPKGLFTINRDTGFLYVTKPLDREATASYTLVAHAVIEGSGLGEKPMEIQVFVIDMNDNNPRFTQDTFMGEVAESSPVGFEFIQVTATDADEEGNANADKRYSILSQDPQSPRDEMFVINPVTGFIRVNAEGLDREINPKYTLEVQAADMAGKGLTGKAKVILTVTDSNDNAPVFVQSQYTATVAENKKDAFVVKMSVTDGDDPHTPAWNAKFTIIDGNQNGLFSVETAASNKQEGIITTAKGLDFENAASHTLLVIVENEVPFAVRLQTATATVTVTVQDVNEPPIFESVVKSVSKPENLPVNSEVVLYSAYDPDTARKQTVMYRIVSDQAGWLNVDKDTGLITVRSEMDRESPLVISNTYTALIGAYDNDEVPATGTGTIQIQLEDVEEQVCNKGPAPHLHLPETGIILTLPQQLPSGMYRAVLRVTDNQGLSQDSTVQAQVCDCTGPDVRCGAHIAGRPSVSLILCPEAGAQ